jgi:hypothetical protein
VSGCLVHGLSPLKHQLLLLLQQEGWQLPLQVLLLLVLCCWL